MFKYNKLAGYRASIDKGRKDFAELLNISIVAYRNKEKGVTPFRDEEKTKLTEYLKSYYPNITIMDIFF